MTQENQYLQLPPFAHFVCECIAVMTPNGEILAANVPTLELLGYTTEDEIRHATSKHSIFSVQSERENFSGLCTNGHEIKNFHVELRTRAENNISVTLNGTSSSTSHGKFIFEGVIVPLQSNTVEVYELQQELIQTRQVLRQTQHHMMQTDKVKAIGEMASITAHEFSNILGAIVGRTQLLQMKTHDEKVLRESTFIAQSAEEGVAAVKELHQFVQKNRHVSFGPFFVQTIFDEAITILDPYLSSFKDKRSTISVEKEFYQLPEIFGYAPEVREIFFLLLRNAFEAIHNSGHIALSAENTPAEIIVKLHNNGPEIPTDVQEKIFQPRYTTKGELHVGLGLTIVRELLRKMKGKLTLTSEPDKGTTFFIHFPKNEVMPAVGGISKHAESLQKKPVCNILIVDDDDVVLRVIDNVLRGEGYITKSLVSSREALMVSKKFLPDVLITDLALPDLNGWELAEKMRVLFPKIKIILTTGWSERISTVELQETAVDILLPKPLSIDDLLHAIAT